MVAAAQADALGAQQVTKVVRVRALGLERDHPDPALQARRPDDADPRQLAEAVQDALGQAQLVAGAGLPVEPGEPAGGGRHPDRGPIGGVPASKRCGATA